MEEVIKSSKRVTLQMTQTLKSKPVFVRVPKCETPGPSVARPQARAEWRLGAQPKPAHITATAAVLWQGKAKPLPSCQAAATLTARGRTRFVHSGEPCAGLHWHSHLWCIFFFLRQQRGSQGWKNNPGHPQLRALLPPAPHSLQHKHCRNAS